MNKLNTWTSTGVKLLHHPRLLSLLKMKKAYPVSLQISPTSKCNLSCSFCSNAKRDKHEELDYEKTKHFLVRLKNIGLKTVEITGGGDPTLYPKINELIHFAYKIGLEVGMITNGVLLKEKLTKESLFRLKWLRISMNSLEYVDHVDIPEIKGTLGFSLCIHKDIQAVLEDRLPDHVAKYHPAYVRVVPDCLPGENEEALREACQKYVGICGEPFFYQEKNFSTPKRCWWNHLKPFLLHDSWIYPCSSVVLNEGSEGVFHHKYRWVHMDELMEVYKQEIVPFPTESCNRCVFNDQNSMVDSVIYPSGMENFL